MSSEIEELLKENEEIEKRRREAERIAEEAAATPVSKSLLFVPAD